VEISVHVEILGTPVGSSPFRIPVQAFCVEPTQCLLTLEPISPPDVGHCDVSANALHLTLLTRNKFGKPTIPADGSKNIHAFWSTDGVTGDHAARDGWNVVTDGLAQYRISCVAAPKQGGQHLLHVHVNGIDVRGSPMLVCREAAPATFSCGGPGVTTYFQTDLQSPAFLVLKAETSSAREVIDAFWAGNKDLLEVTASFSPAAVGGSHVPRPTPLAVWSCIPSEGIRLCLEEWNSITKPAAATTSKVLVNRHKHRDLQAPAAIKTVPLLKRSASMCLWATPITPKKKANHFTLLQTQEEYAEIRLLTDSEAMGVDFSLNDPFQDKRLDEEVRSAMLCTSTHHGSLVVSEANSRHHTTASAALICFGYIGSVCLLVCSCATPYSLLLLPSATVTYRTPTHRPGCL
jgi:hypothetical protein